MSNETPVTSPPDGLPIASKRGGSVRPIGSLRDALIAAGRDDRRVTQIIDRGGPEPRGAGAPPPLQMELRDENPTQPSPVPSSPVAPTAVEMAADAVVQAHGARSRPAGHHIEPLPLAVERNDPVSAPPRTQLVRGRSSVKRSEFHQDPVVGWLVVVGGPGLGAFRPIYEGNNTIGRAAVGGHRRLPDGR